MRFSRSYPWFVLLLLVCASSAFGQDQKLDLKRAVPEDAYLAIHGRHNPERDYQRAYFEAVWETVQETKIIEQVSEIITSQAPEEDLADVKEVLQKLRDAAAPIDGQAILDCREVIYAQLFRMPASQHLVLMRLTPEAAKNTEQGVINLFDTITELAQDRPVVQTNKVQGTVVTTLLITPEVPYRMSVACVDDVLVFATSEEIAQLALDQMVGGQGRSKFDDPRLNAALKKLPEPEDTLVFYDGKSQFEQMRELGTFVRQVSNGNQQAERVAQVIELAFDELSIFDFEVSVEYTEGNLNRSMSYGKIRPDSGDKLIAKVFGSGAPFENWERWVPADALAYSLSSGANLHPLYEYVVKLIEDRFPEARPGLDEFARFQAEIDVDIDRDILQAFSGESVSVTLPAATPSMFAPQDSFTAMRCSKPDRIRELLHRLVEFLQQNPVVASQQLKLVESEELEGFEEISVLALTTMGIRPVIGFHDGWMIIGSNTKVVEKVLDTKAGEGETIADTDAYRKFELEIEGAVQSVSYSNTAESIRGMARGLNQVGMFAPTIIGIVGSQGDAEAVEPVQKLLGLLPSIAKIIAKFDFLEAKMGVVQDGDEPGTYIKRSVTIVRAEQADEAPQE